MIELYSHNFSSGQGDWVLGELGWSYDAENGRLVNDADWDDSICYIALATLIAGRTYKVTVTADGTSGPAWVQLSDHATSKLEITGSGEVSGNVVAGASSPARICFAGSGYPVSLSSIKIETVARYPVKEYILQDIETAINAITEVNSYNQDLTAVRSTRNDFGEFSPLNHQVIVAMGDEEKIDGPAVGCAEWMLPVTCIAIVLDSDAATASLDTRLCQVEADIIAKLRTDCERGGYAIDTHTLASYKFEDDRGFSGIAVNIAVHYRTKFDDPYTRM
jgi:hypothetical protein